MRGVTGWISQVKHNYDDVDIFQMIANHSFVLAFSRGIPAFDADCALLALEAWERYFDCDCGIIGLQFHSVEEFIYKACLSHLLLA